MKYFHGCQYNGIVLPVDFYVEPIVPIFQHFDEADILLGSPSGSYSHLYFFSQLFDHIFWPTFEYLPAGAGCLFAAGFALPLRGNRPVQPFWIDARMISL